MELHQLRYFVALAEAMHVGDAADRLVITAQSLSDEITALETALGMLLFVRSPSNGVMLTAEGERLLPFASTTIAAADELLEVAASLSVRHRRRVRLGIGPFALTGPGLALLTRFRKRFPDIDVDLRKFSWSDPSAGVLSGETDIALVRIPFAAHVRLRTAPVHSDRLVAAVHSEHPFTADARVSLRRLAAEPFVEPAGLRDPVFATRWFLRGVRPAEAPRSVATAAETLDDWLGDIASGSGVALVPEGSIPAVNRPELAFVPVDGVPPSQLVVAWDPARSRAAGEEFASLLSA